MQGYWLIMCVYICMVSTVQRADAPQVCLYETPKEQTAVINVHTFHFISIVTELTRE